MKNSRIFMKKYLSIIVSVLICFFIGYIAQYFQSGSLEFWYPLLDKSPLTPPNIVFPIVWSILYLLMGLSIGLVIVSDSPRKDGAITIFVLQLFFNFIWSILFFYFGSPFLGLIDIIILEVLIIYYIVITYKWFKYSAWLFIPYAIWVGFATYLNLYICMNN